jgi:hypothetical protein
MQNNSIGSPATSKSVIAVGASMSNTDSYAANPEKPPYYEMDPERVDEDDMAYFSSIGPTGLCSSSDDFFVFRLLIGC